MSRKVRYVYYAWSAILTWEQQSFGWYGSKKRDQMTLGSAPIGHRQDADVELYALPSRPNFENRFSSRPAMGPAPTTGPHLPD